jgi:hypothetical protein
MDARSLLAVVRVCRSWAADGLPLLWREATIVALAASPSYGGYNYAAWIRSLTVRTSLPSIHALRSLPPTLPRLQQLAIEGGVVEHEANDVKHGRVSRFGLLLARCGAPTLPLRVRIWAGHWDDMYEFSGGDDSDDDGGGIQEREVFPEHMLRLLASRPRLVSFACDWPLGSRAISGAFAEGAGFEPFVDLEALDVLVAAVSAPLVLCSSMQKTLTVLNLAISVGSAGVLPAVARLVQLRSLAVRWYVDDDVLITADEILALRSLAQLRKAFIMGEQGLVYAPDFGDRECAQLVACWPLLQEWHLALTGSLSPTAFGMIGRHCLELRTLFMCGPSTLCVFEDPSLDPSIPLFPQLRELDLDETVGLDPGDLK